MNAADIIIVVGQAMLLTLLIEQRWAIYRTRKLIEKTADLIHDAANSN